MSSESSGKRHLGGKGEEMSEVEKVVCVSGGSGFIASWLIKLLLQCGYTVKATVRDPDNPKKTEHLKTLDGAKERLHLFKADLLEEGAFDLVVEGCEGVFHTASPVVLSAANPQVEIIDPAVKGTLNILRSCAKVPSIKRVVVTSSMASVATNGKPLTSGVVVDETWFSDPVFCQESKLWYMLSKTLAENAARGFAKENGIDLVTVHPGYTIGPLLQATLNLTSETIPKLINGETFSNMIHRFVDVRDVARAHILAFENHSANGRYCLVGEVAHIQRALQILRNSLPLPEKCEDDKPFPSLYEVSRKKEQALGVNFTPLEVTLRDTIESLEEKGFIKL